MEEQEERQSCDTALGPLVAQISRGTGKSRVCPEETSVFSGPSPSSTILLFLVQY
jgi:hypothetical protein